MPATSPEPSASDIRTLFRAYWSSKSWRRPPELPVGAEFERAVAAGIMFTDVVRLNHDGWVSAATRTAATLSARAVADGFLASLTTRRLDLRSALGSYAVARHLAPHRFGAVSGGHRCSVCDLRPEPEGDLNILSFERFKWGGVRRDDVTYLAFDLARFADMPQPNPTDDDVRIGRELLAAVAAAPATATIPNFAGSLTMLRGNVAERRTVLQILAMCGVLRTPEHPGYRESFVPLAARKLPNRKFIDDPYPACWWSGQDGVDWAAVAEFLPLLA